MKFLSKKADTAATTVEEPPALAVETEAELPAGYEEVVSLLADATAHLLERVGDDKADDLGHREWQPCWALLRFASRLAAENLDDRLTAITSDLSTLLGRVSPLPPGEPALTLVRRLGLQNSGSPSDEAKRLIATIERPSRSQWAAERDTLRDHQRAAEAYQLEKQAEGLERVDREAEERRAQARAMRERAAQLRRETAGHA